MERQLPFNPYDREWELLRPSDGPARYFQLTRVEQLVPILLAAPYFALMVFSAVEI